MHDLAAGSGGLAWKAYPVEKEAPQPRKKNNFFRQRIVIMRLCLFFSALRWLNSGIYFEMGNKVIIWFLHIKKYQSFVYFSPFMRFSYEFFLREDK